MQRSESNQYWVGKARSVDVGSTVAYVFDEHYPRHESTCAIRCGDRLLVCRCIFGDDSYLNDHPDITWARDARRVIFLSEWSRALLGVTLHSQYTLQMRGLRWHERRQQRTATNYRVRRAMGSDAGSPLVYLFDAGHAEQHAVRALVTIRRVGRWGGVSCQAVMNNSYYRDKYNRESRLRREDVGNSGTPKEKGDMIRTDQATIVIGAWYRSQLDMDVASRLGAIDLEVTHASDRWGLGLWMLFRLSLQHPDSTSRLATWLGFIAVVLGFVAVIPVLPAVWSIFSGVLPALGVLSWRAAWLGLVAVLGIIAVMMKDALRRL
jgi:hypothetical protein